MNEIQERNGKIQGDLMAKPFKSLDEQIDYLEKTKAIIFSDKENAKVYLRDSNYFNVISCSKVRFAEKIENGCHVYSLRV
ncbi:hypothetical protein OfM1_20640 [Lactovum odontotermitis]